MSLMWNETYYRWDGTSGVNPAYAGQIDAHDVLILPDKWEYPWPASWDLAFHAVTASLVDQTRRAEPAALHAVRPMGAGRRPHPVRRVDHERRVPADLRVGRRGASTSRATISSSCSPSIPALQRNYDYWWSHNMVGDSLFTRRFAGHGQPAARRRRRPLRPTRAAGWRSLRATWRASRPSCAIRPARSATGSIAARSRRRSTRTCGTSRPASTTT